MADAYWAAKGRERRTAIPDRFQAKSWVGWGAAGARGRVRGSGLGLGKIRRFAGVRAIFQRVGGFEATTRRSIDAFA